MKASIMLEIIVTSWVSCLVLSAVADNPTIRDVVIRQRWPWSRLVSIDYVLDCADGQNMDIRLSAFDGTTPLSLPETSLSGDFFGVSRGFRRIVWDPTKTVYTNQTLERFTVTLTPTQEPLYAIADLTQTNTPDQIQYLYEADLASGAYGTVATNPIPGITSLAWTGVTNGTLYKTDKLVLRRVPAGSYLMGGTKPVTLTKPFYVGVFEVTQRQWERVMGIGQKPSWFNNPDYYMMRPVEQISYNMFRGATNDNPEVNWPNTDRTVVTANSFLGKLRSQTGITAFDLPTAAQWEYACRAGVSSAVFNDGSALANVLGDNANTNVWMNTLGRYKFNGGFLSDGTTQPLQGCEPTNGTAIVGSYKPNAWGLYDMHGNVYEFCLDWGPLTDGGVDPTGPMSGSQRWIQGGSAFETARTCSLTSTGYGVDPSAQNGRRGFRLVWTLL